jgi:uncharacterized RDD family membrane protein YckC
MTPDPDLQPQFYDAVPTKRLLAWVVDMFVVAGMTLVAVPLTAFIGLFFLPFLFVTISFCYRVVTLARGSATWGMRLMSIELRDRDDAPFDLSTAFLHTLGYAVSWGLPILQIASIVLMLSTQRRQGLSDLVLGTVALNRRS